MPNNPMAFMSYVRFDDEFNNGRLTTFRERLSGEIRIHTGEDFPIFQDRNDIKWGQNWKARIEEAIDGVTFLIPIITPSFFKSPACRDELESFLSREKQLDRTDLILPVYFVECPGLNLDSTDELLRIIASRNYEDWRHLRHESFSSPEVSRALEKLAVQVRDSIITMLPLKVKIDEMNNDVGLSQLNDLTQQPSEGHTSVSEGSAGEGQRIITVDPFNRGDYATIMEAVHAASAGDRIMVRPGIYKEALVIDKVLEIIGDGELREIVVMGTEQNALQFQASMGRISNLTFQQSAHENLCACVAIYQGRLELVGCDISCNNLSGIIVQNGANPWIHSNMIHDCVESGVFVYDAASGTYEENEIWANGKMQVAVSSTAEPIFRANRISGGMSAGVGTFQSGNGVFEDNVIVGNATGGIAVKDSSRATARRNRIYNNSFGIVIYPNGSGLFEDNAIFNNHHTGVYVSSTGNPTFRNNKIYDNPVDFDIRDDSFVTREDNNIEHESSVG